MSHLFLNWTVLDYILALVILFSIVISFFRGFVSEVISLATWFFALYAALNFSNALSGIFHSLITNPKSRYILSFVVVFILVLILGALIRKLANGLVKAMFLGFFDKILGFVFGAARGVLFAVIILLILQIGPVNGKDWIKQSQLAPNFQGLVQYFDKLLPKDMFDLSSLTNKLSSFSLSLASHMKH